MKLPNNRNNATNLIKVPTTRPQSNYMQFSGTICMIIVSMITR
jgi:hypothetical protein